MDWVANERLRRGLDNLWRAIAGVDERASDYGFVFAENEVEAGDVVAGLWSKALVKAKGNEELRKIEYMKLRGAQIKNSGVAK